MKGKPGILVTRRWPPGVQAYLAKNFRVRLNEPDKPMGPAELMLAARRFEVLCPTVSDRLDANIVEQPDAQTLLICNYGAGVDHIDLDACRRMGIVVTNTPDILTEATAELAIALMLMACRRAGEGERELRASRWKGWRPTHLLGAQMTGKTLGLVGFGRIAQATAAKAAGGFGMRIVYHSRNRAPALVEQRLGARQVSLDELLATSDFVSLHCPGGAETRHLINERRLAQMRRSAFLINTARGSVVDEAALIVALQGGTIAGAGLDVFEGEPRVPAELRACPNAVLLPHLGSATLETREAMGRRAVVNLEAWLRGEPPPDRVA